MLSAVLTREEKWGKGEETRDVRGCLEITASLSFRRLCAKASLHTDKARATKAAAETASTRLTSKPCSPEKVSLNYGGP